MEILTPCEGAKCAALCPACATCYGALFRQLLFITIADRLFSKGLQKTIMPEYDHLMDVSRQ